MSKSFESATFGIALHGPSMRAMHVELMPRTWRKHGFEESSGVVIWPKEEVAPVSKKKSGPVYSVGDESLLVSYCDSEADTCDEQEEVLEMESQTLVSVMLREESCRGSTGRVATCERSFGVPLCLSSSRAY